MDFVSTLDGAWREPVDALAAFADEPWAIGFLSGGGGPRGRWSYLARRPDRVLVLDADAPGDPFEALTRLLGAPSPAMADGPPFQGGVAGLCAYELGARSAPLALDRLEGWPDIACARYPAVLAFDHVGRRMIAIGRGEDAAGARGRAAQALEWAAGPQPVGAKGALAAPLAGEPSHRYEAAVADVVERIAAGEIFQANIARAWRGRLGPGMRPFDLLARLAGESPAPFAGYLRLPDRAVVSNSPERFVSVERAGGVLRVETRPIKGTQARARDPGDDARRAAVLTASPKDRAENLMIVDLMRNDLSRVCRTGSVAAPELFRLESFANVHHLVSTVTGELARERTAIDLLRACLPPGSITGAPKVQAMKVIAGHEPPRGPFFGSLFWAGFDGALDSSVLIRTAAFVAEAGGWNIEIRAGAGIVADSDLSVERQETEAKIGALLAALRGAPDQALADST